MIRFPEEIRLISWAKSTFLQKSWLKIKITENTFLRHSFVDERAMITTILIFSCHWKTIVTFCLRKKRLEKAFLTLTMNYRKIIQKHNLCHTKEQQIGYLMLVLFRCYSVVLIEKLAFFNKQL